MADLCKKCSKCEFNMCLEKDLSIHKIPNEIVKDYNCFKSRFYNITPTYHDCNSGFDSPYGNRMSDKEVKDLISSLRLSNVNAKLTNNNIMVK